MLNTILSFLFSEPQTKDESIMDFTKKPLPKRPLNGFDEWLKWHEANNNILIKVKNI